MRLEQRRRGEGDEVLMEGKMAYLSLILRHVGGLCVVCLVKKSGVGVRGESWR